MFPTVVYLNETYFNILNPRRETCKKGSTNACFVYQNLHAKFANLTLSELFTKIVYKVPLHIIVKEIML